LVTLAATALAVPAAASAVPAVLAPVDVSTPGAPAGQPQVGMDAGGSTVVVWQSQAGPATSVMAATRAPASEPSAPVTLSGPAGGSAPALALVPSGEAIAAWWRPGETGTVVQASSRPAGGAFAPPVDLSAPGAFAPQVALAPGGGAVVAWVRFDGERFVIEAAVRTPSGSFGPPIPLSAPGRVFAVPRVAVDAAGRVAVTWNRSDGRPTMVEAAVGTLADGFGAAQALSAPGEDAYDPQIALLPAGGALATWTRSDGAHTRTQLAVIGADGGAAQATSVSAPGADARQPRIVVDAAGAALVVWRRGAAGAERVQVMTRGSDGAAEAPADLSAAGVPAADPGVALDGAGRAVVTWRRADGSDPRVQVATRDPGGAFTPPVDVSARGAVVADPGVALDGAGNGVVVWRRADGDDDIVQIAGLDDAPPVLLDVTVPATARAFDVVRVSARARDVWSPLAPGPSWTFGRAGGGLGASLEYAFPTEGDILVRVAQADTTGQVAVAERRITIGPPVPVVVPAPGPAAAAPTRAAPTRAASVRAAVSLRVAFRWDRRSGRLWLRTRGTTAKSLAGRRVFIERRVGRWTVVVARITVGRRGGIDGRFRVASPPLGGTVRATVRARVTATRLTRARTLPYVTRSIVIRRAAATR